ncbi:MAG TPA: SRPBCC domain-containing protein [Acidimicrobiales bacterium]|jgi:hypothetical protein|nr:SRPBCC domain-containing protein [Acidimicrobiales bacterium]
MRDILHREVEVPCDVEAAWQHVIDPSWLGDDGELDVVPGGEGWVRDGEETKYLVVEEVDNERHLTFRWASFVDAPSRVDIDLEPTPEGTRISISESPLEARAMAGLVTR